MRHPTIDPIPVLMKRRRVMPSGCWEWTGASRNGYGRMKFAGRLQNVHRIAWAAWRGEVPDGLLVLHRCDNPPCFNPDHLFVGTDRDNSLDMGSKGRNVQRKLNAEQVQEIARRMSEGQSPTAVGARFGVDKRVVRLIAAGKTYADVAREFPARSLTTDRRPARGVR